MKSIFYAIKSKNKDVRVRSSSGGIFFELAKATIDSKGVVYGAIYNEKFEVIHSRADNIELVKKMNGSKYAQSDIGTCFEEAKKDLQDGKKVLFTGTPCQIKALNLYLKESYKNLVTIDVVCHGTPEKKYLKDYLLYLEKKYNSKVCGLNMRYKNPKKYDKKMNLNYVPIGMVEPHIMRIDFKNNKKYVARSDFDIYYQLFDYFIRQGCFKCPYSNLNRVSDITIGDFHEFSSKLGKFNDGNGISLVICNTEKGLNALKEIESELCIEEKEAEKCLQPALQSPANPPKDMDKFIKDYETYGFEYIVKEYGQKGLKYNIRKLLYRIGILDELVKIKRKIK